MGILVGTIIKRPLAMTAFRILALACLAATAAAHTWLNGDASKFDDENDWPLSVQDVSLSCDAANVDHSKTVIAAVGDSITVGATCNTWRGGFVKILQDVLGTEKYDVRDCGLCGHDAVRKGHGNLKHATYWGTPALTNSKAMKPDVIIYMLGTNDADEWYNTSKYYNQDMKDLINEYITLPNKPTVHTMIPPPLSNYTCAGNPNPTCLSPYNKACVIDCVLPQIVPQLNKELGLAPPVDLLSFIGGPTHTNKTLMPGLHPDCNGYVAIGHYLAKVLFNVTA